MNIPETLVKQLRDAERVVVLTGAGISAESNIPTFRDAMSGLWARYRPEDLATPEAFQRNPKLVWDWYQWRRELVEQAEPNPGHHALAQLEAHVPHFLLVTQNVDSLHQRAGSKAVVELHGNISRVKCYDEHTIIDTWEEAEETPPHCPNCNAFLRPDVVWFGEALPEDAIRQAAEAVRECDLFFSIGTSSQVYPAAGLIHGAKPGAVTVEINPHLTPHTSVVTHALKGASGELLPELVGRAFN